MAYNPRDFYFKQAKKDDFAARSAYKLEEIDQRHRIIHSNDHIVDLGAAPGSWSQYCARKIGKNGRILGIDLQKIAITLPNARFIQEDLHNVDLEKEIRETEMRFPVDVVISDMAPRTTGIRLTDQARSLELCELALNMAIKCLKPGGHFVCKLFQSEDFEDYRKSLKENFEKVEILRPKSTRKESKEVFLIGLKFKPKVKSSETT